MQYMLLIYGDERFWANASPEELQSVMSAYNAYTKAIVDAGVFVAGAPLEDTQSATTVRVLDGRTQTIDGPFAETKEQLGGYYLIDVPDADEALRWAARCPGASRGSIEVRPVAQIPMPA